MKRRKLLKIAAGLAGGAVILPTGLYLASPGWKEVAAQKIHQELHYLTLDKAGVSRFIDDYLPGYLSQKDHIRGKLYYYLNTSAHHSNNLFELVRSYLMASDFFLNKMDTTKTVKYLGLFDPYKSPVANPFSYIYSEE